MMEIMVYIYFSSLSTPRLPYYQKLESCYPLGALILDDTWFLCLGMKWVFPRRQTIINFLSRQNGKTDSELQTRST